MWRLLVWASAALVSMQPLAAVDYTFLPALSAPDPASLQLLDIARCGSRLVAVGERGVIVHADADADTLNWTQAPVPVNQTLTAVACASADLIWAVGHGGVILHSADGGASWKLQFDGMQANKHWLAYTRSNKAALELELASATGSNLEELEYAIEDAEYAVEDAVAAQETGPADPFLDVWFRDGGYGIAVGAYGMIYATDDGGESWTLQADAIENPDRYHYYKLASYNSRELYLSGEAGLLYSSRDGGGSWERLDPGYAGSLFGLVAMNDGAVVCFGLRGNILLSVDGGDSWRGSRLVNDPGLSLYDGVQLDGGAVILVGAGGVVLTSVDNGRQFESRVDKSRSTLSGLAPGGGSRVVAVGMDGVQQLAGDKL